MLFEDDVFCMMCGKFGTDAPGGVEEDVNGDWWSYCRKCNTWTSHPEKHEAVEATGET